MESDDTQHRSVLLREVVDLLSPHASGLYVDGTLGYGGHSAEILRVSSPDGCVIGIDRDRAALDAATERLREFGTRFTPIHGTFGEVDSVLRELGHAQVDGIVLDVGVSSPQLDQAERGFSFSQPGPLDMRMDASSGETVEQLLRQSTADELAALIKEYGEERYAKRIAAQIKDALRAGELTDTVALAEVIAECIPARERHKRKTHPATKTFQALRIAVNDELGQLRRFLDVFPTLLAAGGRCVIISFHSLEDRLVKNRFRELAWSSSLPPEYAREAGERVHPIGKVLTRKPISASPDELAANPRARSARLRAFEKLEERP